MLLIICDFLCGKGVLDNLYSGRVQGSANGTSQNNAGFCLDRCEGLGRPVCNSYSEEQQWHPTLRDH